MCFTHGAGKTRDSQDTHTQPTSVSTTAHKYTAKSVPTEQVKGRSELCKLTLSSLPSHCGAIYSVKCTRQAPPMRPRRLQNAIYERTVLRYHHHLQQCISKSRLLREKLHASAVVYLLRSHVSMLAFPCNGYSGISHSRSP